MNDEEKTKNIIIIIVSFISFPCHQPLKTLAKIMTTFEVSWVCFFSFTLFICFD